jgi:hypothetical protein
MSDTLPTPLHLMRKALYRVTPIEGKPIAVVGYTHVVPALPVWSDGRSHSIPRKDVAKLEEWNEKTETWKEIPLDA